MAQQSVYDQLKQLKRIPNAKEDWAEYRMELSDYILSETIPGTTLLIVGAGACNDFDLQKLSGHFNEITLLDFEEDDMRAAVSEQITDECLRKKFKYVSGSVTGISERDYRRFADSLRLAVNLYGRDTDINALSKIALTEMDRAFSCRKSSQELLKDNSFDYILCFGVHSQINSMYPWIWEAFCNALDKSDISVHQKAREYNNILVKELNENILTASVNGVFFGLEEVRFGVGGAVEGAFQGITDLNERIKSASIDLISHRDALWPFNPDAGIVYNMKWVHVKKH